MDDRLKISLLLDVYGNLLTEKQRELMSLYYNEDLSLAEIAEFNETSRQAIHDVIKRCQKILNNYEEKLNVLDKLNFEIDTKNKIIKDINSIIDLNNINEIKKELISLIDFLNS